ncbi:MAG: hypothetical protein H0T44_01795 [Gemmatimonadales bacterium]|nr:hypothetical protein [Gemmatimonadales bacterium]
MSIPIDECLPAEVATTTNPPNSCTHGSTDGDFDGFAFIDALGCNDGDPYVGALRGEDDDTCNVNYKGTDYPNWDAFEAAFPGARIGRNAQTFIAVDQPVHYLIYRVNIS